MTVRGYVRNLIAGWPGVVRPTNQAHAGATVRFVFPAGTEAVGLPDPHALYDCATGTDRGDTTVSCVHNSPLAPHVASIALNVRVRVPADWPVGRPYRTVACTAPVAGQAGELVPAAGRPCDLGTPAALTPTDNDADLMLVVLTGPG
jgi:hypothetical protein